MSADAQVEAPAEFSAASDLLTGNAGLPRFLAAQIDHVAALVLFFAAAMTLPQYLGEIVAGCLAFGAYVGYYFLTEWLLGATPGKMLSGLAVRQLDGQRCTAAQIAIRTLLRLVEVNVLLLGALPAGVAVLATKRHQRLGDLLAGTVVVLEARPRAPERRVVIRKR